MTALLWTMTTARSRHRRQPADPGAARRARPTPQTLTVPLATLVRNLAPGTTCCSPGRPRCRGSPREPYGSRPGDRLRGGSDAGALPPTAPATARHTAAGRVHLATRTLTVLVTADDEDVSTLRPVLGTPQAGGISMRYGFRDLGTLIPTPAMTLDKLPATVYVPADLNCPPDWSPCRTRTAPDCWSPMAPPTRRAQ